MSIHLVLLIVYSAALVAVGLWISRSVRGSSDFFVAGRSLTAPLIFSTMLAANIGAGTTVGAAGLAYVEGISALWWNASVAIGSFALAFWVGPRMWRIASAQGLYTAGDYLEYRYDARVRAIVAILIWVGTLAILAAQLIAGAAVLNAVGGLSKPAGVAISGVVMMVYFAAGGLLSSAWVNVVQLIVLMAGFLIAMPLLYNSVGGAAGFSSMALPHPGYWDVMYSKGTGMSGWAMLFVLTPAFIVSPGLLQKAYGAVDERAVKVGVGMQALAQLAFAAVPVFFGIAARAASLDVASANAVLPAVLTSQLPPLVGALGLAAVFSAEVSTCDAILFMLATSLSKDLYKRFIDPDAGDQRVLRVARLAAVGGGIGGMILAIQLATIADALRIFYSLLGVSLFVPIIGGLYTRRAGPPQALASIAAGMSVLLAVRFLTGPIGPFNEELLGLVAAAAAFTVTMAVRGRGADS